MSNVVLAWGGYQSPSETIYAGTSSVVTASGTATVPKTAGQSIQMRSTGDTGSGSYWLTSPAVSATDDVGAGNTEDIMRLTSLDLGGGLTAFIYVRVQYAGSANKYNIGLYEDNNVTGVDVSDFGTSQFDVDSLYALRIEDTGTELILEFNGAEEARITYTSIGAGLSSDLVGYCRQGNSGMTVKVPVLSQGDRPGVDNASGMFTLAGNTLSYADFNKAGTGTNPDYLDQNELETTDQDGLTTYDSDTLGTSTTQRQAFTTTAPTMSNVVLVTWFAYLRNNIAAKAVDYYSLWFDGTNLVENLVRDDFVDTTFTLFTDTMTTAPDTSAWSQTDMDDLRIGVKAIHGAAGDQQAYLTAVYAEALSMTLDPVASAASTSGPALMNAGNVGIF